MILDPINTSDSDSARLNHQHTMLLYSSDDGKASIKYVNEGLDRGSLTVYSPINSDNNNNKSHMYKVASEIVNYKDNMNRGNLLTLETRSFYNFALVGNMQPFEELKILLEEAIEERKIASDKSGDVIVVGGIAAELARNQKFDESIM